MNYKILVVGAAFVNKGAEAMIRCVQRGIISQIPEAQGLLDASPNDHWSPQELRGLQPRIGLNYRGRFRRLASAAANHLSTFAPRRVRVGWLGAASGTDFRMDAVVDISGYAVGDHQFRGPQLTGLAHLRSRAARVAMTDLEVLSALGLPFFYLPAVWGPLERRQAREVADANLRRARRVYVRDRESLEWLEGLPSFSPDKVALASDIAFTFEGASPETGRRLLGDIGVRPDGSPLIGIVPNMRVYERAAGTGPDNLYVRALVDVARHFANEVGCQVAVMPHEIKSRPHAVPDDRYLCRLIVDGACDAGTVCAAVGQYSSEELKAMIGEVDLLVSSRFHSIVAAMSLRVPVVSVSWSHKYRQLMRSVDLGDYVLEHEDLGDISLVDLCDHAWESRARMVEALEEGVPHHEVSARQVLDETVALIREHSSI